MPSDRSRRTDDLRDGYKEIVAQQGRVILDRDFNALQGLTDERIAADARDMVGPCGTPDDGFAISLPQTSPPGPPFWSPPGGFGPVGPQDYNFVISPGTMYVGGQRAVFPGRQAGQAVTYSYYDQPDWIDPPDPVLFKSPPGFREFVYLDLAEHEVSGVEDPDVIEVALGGPDTTGRIKLMHRIRREAATQADCAEARQEAASRWLKRDGLQLDPETMRLEPVARLQVGFTQDVTTQDPCDPVATGGYLGADNQLIRVQISHSGRLGAGGEAARLLWGYDNASFLYRVTSASPDGTLLTLASDPPDAFHIPQSGQLVEILLTEAILGKEPDETDPTGKRSILRVVAAANGELRHLSKPYGSIMPGDPTKYIVLDQPLVGAYAKNSPTPLFLRIWQAELSFNPAGDTVQLNDPASGASTGVQVTISVPPGEVATKDAFWLLAMRPSTPQAVYPERLLTEPQPPDGPRRWVCPLAVIDWQAAQGPLVYDCRCKFDNLVTLTKRPPSCCTVRVSPEQLTATNTLQSIIDAAADRADQVTVCLTPGLYTLQQPLRLDRQHTGMAIEACGGTARISGAGQAFSDGLVVLTEAAAITLRGLTLIPPPVEVPNSFFERVAIGLDRCVVTQAREAVAEFAKQIVAHLRLQLAIGIRAVSAIGLVIEDCSVELTDAPGEDYCGIGVFASGICIGLTVRGCNFTTTFSPTATPGVVQPRGLSAPVFQFSPQPAPFGLHAAIGCLVSPFVSGFPSPDADGVEPFTLPAQLDGANFSDNTFARTTLAVAAMADIGTIRVRGNTVSNSIGGFWIKTNELSEFRFSTGDTLPADGDATWLDLALSNQECFLLLVLGLVYPMPAVATTSVSQRSVGPASMFIADNHIEALPPDPARAPEGICALAVLTGLPGGYTGTSGPAPGLFSGLAVSSNRLQGQPSLQYPAVMLVYSGRCVITGNLISAVPSTAAPMGTSLYIVPEGNRVTTPATFSTGACIPGATGCAENLTGTVFAIQAVAAAGGSITIPSGPTYRAPAYTGNSDAGTFALTFTLPAGVTFTSQPLATGDGTLFAAATTLIAGGAGANSAIFHVTVLPNVVCNAFEGTVVLSSFPITGATVLENPTTPAAPAATSNFIFRVTVSESKQAIGSPPNLEGAFAALAESTNLARAPHLSVTGNVLEGLSNLGTLLRLDLTTPPLPAPFTTWLPFNSTA